VAKAVAEKTHTVENVELVVNLYTPPIPPPSYPNKFLIKGLTEKTNETVLGLYLEAKAGCALVPGGLTYHADDETTAVITVEGDVGMLSLLCYIHTPYPSVRPSVRLSIHPSTYSFSVEHKKVEYLCN